MEFLASHIRETSDIAGGYLTGTLFVEGEAVGLQRQNGEEILLDDTYMIEVRNGDAYQQITIQEALTAITGEGWPLYAGLYARVKRGQEEMSTHSKRAIWLAVNSEHGDRLVEITQEHTALARDLAVNKHLTDAEKESYKARIEQLRQERDTILQQFEQRQQEVLEKTFAREARLIAKSGLPGAHQAVAAYSDRLLENKKVLGGVKA